MCAGVLCNGTPWSMVSNAADRSITGRMETGPLSHASNGSVKENARVHGRCQDPTPCLESRFDTPGNKDVSYSIVIAYIEFYWVALYRLLLCCIVLHYIVLCCIALHCTGLHWIVLCCVALRCVALRCVVLYSIQRIGNVNLSFTIIIAAPCFLNSEQV